MRPTRVLGSDVPEAIGETEREAWANVLTHGLGAVVAVGVAVTMLLSVTAYAAGPVRAVVVASVGVFGWTLVAMFVASTLYHGTAPHRRRLREVLRRLDHASIYLLIAGTYTPLMLVTLGGPWGRAVTITVWGLAVPGVVLSLTCIDRAAVTQLLLKLGMGWLIVAAVASGMPMFDALSGWGLTLLVAGGVLYTLGVPFYLWRRLRYHHAVWHAFVLGGAGCHAAMMFTDVVG